MCFWQSVVAELLLQVQMQQPAFQQQKPAAAAAVKPVELAKLLLIQAFLDQPSYWPVTLLGESHPATSCVQDELQWRTLADPSCHLH